jgi:hypothetical protein
MKKIRMCSFKKMIGAVAVVFSLSAVSPAVNAMDGFGILAMASIGPILSVMGTGLWINWKIKRRHSVNTKQEMITESVEG